MDKETVNKSTRQKEWAVMKSEEFRIARVSSLGFWIAVSALVFIGLLAIRLSSPTVASIKQSPTRTILEGIVLPLAIFLVCGHLAIMAWATKFLLTDEGLHIKSGLYRRFIRRGSLIIESARALNLESDEDYRPRRIYGIGLPGLCMGWCRLKSGEKALVFLTDPSSVFFVSTSEGYVLLLSTDRPEEFVRAIEQE